MTFNFKAIGGNLEGEGTKKGTTRFPFQIHVCGSLFSEENQCRSNDKHQACANGSAPIIGRPRHACGPK